jgi:hypothetical protein
MSRNSLALGNLRGVVILIVVAFHSASAYLGSLPAASYPFDKAPYLWSAFPIVDKDRWFGLDLLCAWQDIYLMCLMYFLSALFTWSSLKRKGTAKFLGDRFLRLGVPLLFGIIVLMPIALYPVYRVTAADPSVSAYLHHLWALPFWPNGPMWFLWQLLALSISAACVHQFAPGFVGWLAKLSSRADKRPDVYFIGLTAVCIVAYVPLALAFTPFAWLDRGPFSIQLCRPLLYIVAYFAGLGVGAYGLERGLLATDGMLERRWARWLGLAFATYFLWIGLAALSLRPGVSAPLWLQILMDVGFTIACTAGWFGALALCLRFGAVRSRLLRNLSDDAFGIYVLHYPFGVWMQYALLSISLFAIGKVSIVFAGSLTLSWLTIAALRTVPFGIGLVGGERLRRGPEVAGPIRESAGASPEVRLPHVAR